VVDLLADRGDTPLLGAGHSRSMSFQVRRLTTGVVPLYSTTIDLHMVMGQILRRRVRIRKSLTMWHVRNMRVGRVSKQITRGSYGKVVQTSR